MRAQRAYNQFDVDRAQRLPITKTNIVVSEPMPGDAKLVDEFAASLKPAVLGGLFKKMVEEMKLAGELGSLLKIEESIAKAVKEAEEAHRKEGLFAEKVESQDFWDTADEKIIAALGSFAESAAGAVGVRRQLFVGDAAQGVAFIELMRKRFDAVLMNPPFGLGPKSVAKYLNSQFVGSGVKELAASFYTRSLELLEPTGRIGEISSRTCFFLPTLADWRRDVVFEQSTLIAYADLGENILDGAVNETAAYVVQKGREVNATCIFGMFHREEQIDKALNELATCTLGPRVTVRLLTDLEVLEDRPLCYWTSNAFVRALPHLRPLGQGAADVQMGLAPRDEFRFSRLWWEIRQEEVGTAGTWLGYAKGGELSPYYSDVELVLNARDDLREIRAALNHKYPYLKGNLSWVLHPENDYFMPGLTFGQRTAFLRMSVLPAGCYFSVAGKAVFGRKQSSKALLQAINTPAAQFLVSLRRERLALDPQFQQGDVERMPWPELSDVAARKLEQWGHENTYLVQSVASFDETDHAFQRISIDGAASLASKVATESILRNEARAS